MPRISGKARRRHAVARIAVRAGDKVISTRTDRSGYFDVLVQDHGLEPGWHEVVIEADPRISLATVCEQMGRTPSWAKGLLLRADGYETDFYKKD